jgi:hypothetical protein
MPSSLDRDIKVTYPALPGIRLCNRQIRDGRAPQPYDLHARRCAVSATFIHCCRVHSRAHRAQTSWLRGSNLMCRKEAQGPKRAEGAYDRCLLSPSALLRPSGEQPLDTIQHELVVVARSTHRARTDGFAGSSNRIRVSTAPHHVELNAVQGLDEAMPESQPRFAFVRPDGLPRKIAIRHSILLGASALTVKFADLAPATPPD